MPPDIDIEPFTNLNATLPLKPRDLFSSGVQSESGKGAMNHDQTCFMITELELHALLERNRQSLLELFMKETFHGRHPIDTIVPIPTAVDSLRSESFGTQVSEDRLLMELSRCLESSFAEKGISHPILALFLEELARANYTSFADLVAELAGDARSENSLQRRQPIDGASQGADVALQEGDGERRSASRAFVAALRLSYRAIWFVLVRIPLVVRSAIFLILLIFLIMGFF